MENIVEATQSIQSILLGKHENFTRQGEQFIATHIKPNEYKVPEIFKNYEYPVSAWPVLIDQGMARQLERLSIRIPELIRQIPALYFENDVKRIAEYYYKGNEMVAQFAMLSHNKNVPIGCRLDLTYTDQGFKILEANIGSSIGGFQVQSFESIIRGLHPTLTASDTRRDFKSKNTQVAFMKFLVDQIVEYVPSVTNEINVFISLDHLKSPELRRKSISFFNELLQNELHQRGFRGQAISGAAEAIEFLNGKLLLDGLTIHSALILNLAETNIPPVLFRAFMMNAIYFPDHLGVAMYGDKRNLSLLRILAEAGKFSEEDNELVLQGIPWTSFVDDKEVRFRGMSYPLFALLRKHKNDFVIKASNGYQGKDVFVGKFSSPEEWDAAIQLAESSQAFIAQEFCDSIDFLAPDHANLWAPHKLIWGAFGFGEYYGGVWVRMSAIETDVGVINSATGAVEAIVYEQLESS